MPGKKGTHTEININADYDGRGRDGQAAAKTAAAKALKEVNETRNGQSSDTLHDQTRQAQKPQQPSKRNQAGERDAGEVLTNHNTSPPDHNTSPTDHSTRNTSSPERQQPATTTSAEKIPSNDAGVVGGVTNADSLPTKSSPTLLEPTNKSEQNERAKVSWRASKVFDLPWILTGRGRAPQQNDMTNESRPTRIAEVLREPLVRHDATQLIALLKDDKSPFKPGTEAAHHAERLTECSDRTD